jgi:hypothetical protein
MFQVVPVISSLFWLSDDVHTRFGLFNRPFDVASSQVDAIEAESA